MATVHPASSSSSSSPMPTPVSPASRLQRLTIKTRSMNRIKTQGSSQTIFEKMHDQAKSAKRLMTLSESTRRLDQAIKKGKDAGTPDHTPLERSKTRQVKELQATMEAAQEQLRPFCMSESPKDYFGCNLVYVLHVCFRPLLERFAPHSWKGFYVELARLGGPSGVLTLLTIARIDADGGGDIDEEELKAFDRVAEKLIRDTCDALQMSAVVASLLFGATFQSVIGRPQFMYASPETIQAFGETASEVLLWVAFVTMSLISVLCLIIIAFAFGSRMELQNVLPSTQARLFYMLEVNPMNTVTAMSMISMLLFLVLIVAGGLCAHPWRGFFTITSIPLFILVAWPLWQGMRNGPVRLRLEARAFLGIENRATDQVRYAGATRRPNAKSCRLKHFLVTANKNARPTFQPRMLSVVEEALDKKREAEAAADAAAGFLNRQRAASLETTRSRSNSMDSISEEDGGAREEP